MSTTPERDSSLSVRFSTFPRTEPPPTWVAQIMDVFQRHHSDIDTEALPKGLTSDETMSVLALDLEAIGFTVEKGKKAKQKIERPVFFGENGVPTVRYQVDGYHPVWRCGLEIEAGRGWMGNAVYRDLVHAMVMVDVDWLCLAVANSYKFSSGGKDMSSRDYDNARDLADALYGHTRVRLPYHLLLIGY